MKHIGLFALDFCVLVGLAQSIQIFSQSLPLFNFLVLSYMLIHTTVFLSIQVAVQILELIRIRSPSLLMTYYFQFSDEEMIPVRLLDPTKSRLAVVILLLVISGAPILYPIFSIYGFLIIVSVLMRVGIDPGTIVRYFEVFLNWMPPVLGIMVAIVIISIVAIEFKHV